MRGISASVGAALVSFMLLALWMPGAARGAPIEPGAGGGAVQAGAAAFGAGSADADTAYQAGCPTPRPPVKVEVVTVSEGRLRVTITAGYGALRLVRFGTLQNARVVMPNTNQAIQSVGTDQGVKPPDGARTWTFDLVSEPSGQPRPITVPLEIIDDCGDSQVWRTFVGGGPAALQARLAIADAQATEGNSGTTALTFPVTLSMPASQPVTVQYATANGTATAPGDYASASGTLTFTAGETQKSVTVQVQGDTTNEPDETFTVTLSNPQGAAIERGQATGTIRDDDDVTPPSSVTVSLSLTGSPMAENGGEATVTATLSGPATQPVTVTLGFGGTATLTSDYTRSGTSIAIPAGQTAGSITLRAVQDTADEPNETIVVSIDSVTNGTAGSPNQVTATITDDDAAAPAQPSVSLSVTGSPMSEAGGKATVTATLSAPASQAVTVNLSFNGTATLTADYTRSGTSIAIPAGQTTGSITVEAVQDGADEPDETIVVGIASVTNATTGTPNQVTVTLTDDDNRPSVVTTVPANAAANVGIAADVSVTFSEPVNVAGNWFEIACALSGTRSPSLANVAVSGGPTTFTLDPSANFSENEACTLTIFAAQVTDQDAGQSPSANHVVTFTTDAGPLLTSTTPADNATGVPANTTITLNFSESVTLDTNAVEIRCPAASAPIAYTPNPSNTPAASHVLTPTGGLPPTTTCQVTVLAAGVHDGDAGDPPDSLTADYVFDFTTVDVAPTVLSVPLSGGTNVKTDADIVVNFSEPVTVGPTSFGLSCTPGGAQAFTLTGSDTATVTLDPGSNLPEGASCTLTVVAANVVDSDAVDPPDAMAGPDQTYTFTVDAAPTVTTTTPADNTTGVALNGDIVVTFSEPVTVSASSFSIVCTPGGAQTFTIGGNTTNQITLNPDADLPATSNCVVTVVAAQVSDVDTGDPPDTMAANHVFDFTTVDTAPTVVSVPLSGGTNVRTDTDIVVNFSEPVTVGPTSFGLSCTPGGAQAFTLTGSGTATVTLDPGSNLPEGASCTLTIVTANVVDSDAVDPPDEVAGPNQTYTFTTDAAPTVTTTTPADNASGVDLNGDIVVDFSEAVTVTVSSFSIVCTPGGAQTFTIGGNTTNQITLNPDADLPATSNCVVTVVAAQVSDVDTGDPPDTMAANHVFDFTTDDTAPTVLSVPLNGGTNVRTDTDVVVNFSEPVTVGPTSFGLSCTPGGAQTFTLIGSGTATVTLDPGSNLPEGASCTLTIVTANVVDSDAVDPPDEVAGPNQTYTFTTDAAPTVTTTTPADNATDVALASNIAIDFSEAVTVTGSSFSIVCTPGGAQTFAVGGNTTNQITLNPDADLPSGATCTVTVVAAQVSDVDTGDPPDGLAANYVFDFNTVDTAPTLLTTVPANNATGVAADTDITLTFSEPVNFTDSSFTIECPTGAVQAFAATGDGTSTATLNPTANLPAGVVCTVTVIATGVTDVDPADPPNRLNDPTPTNEVFSFTIPPVATNDTYAATGNIAINIPAASGVLDNDIGPSRVVAEVQGAAGNVGVAVDTTATGLGGVKGRVTLQTDGSFLYDPPPGVTETSDTFTYRISNAAGTSNLATVTINLTDVMWFVCQGCSGNNRGTLLHPFTSIASFSTANTGLAPAPQPGHKVYIRSGTYASGTLTLRDNQVVTGQGAAASSAITPQANSHADFATLTAGARPVLSPATGNAVAVASGNTLRHFNVGTTEGTAAHIGAVGATVGTLTIDNLSLGTAGTPTGRPLAIPGGTLAATLDSVASTASSGSPAIELVGVGGALTVNGTGTVTGATAGLFRVSGGTVGVTFNGNLTQASNAFTVSVAGGHQTGTLAFSGALSATDGTGLQFDNADGTYQFNGTTTLGGGDAGIDIVNNSGGTFTFANTTTITNPSGIAYREDTSTATVTYSGTITKSNNANSAVDVNAKSGGTTTFGGSITASTTTANAIDLTNLAGSVSFNGGLSLTTTAGTGFNANGGGGTVGVSGAATNTIGATGGTALNVANVNIAGTGLTFQSIAATGGPGGIVLNTTGSSGGLTVTGTGGANSGGIIQNTTGDGIALTSTRNVSLADVRVTNSGAGIAANTNSNNLDASSVTNLTLTRFTADSSVGHGVQGNGITNLVISASTFNGGGEDTSVANFDGVHLTNVLGVSSITGSTISNSNTRQLRVLNNQAVGSPDVLTITNLTYGQHTGPNRGDNGNFRSDTGGNLKVVINGMSIAGSNLGGSLVDAGAQGSGRIDIDATNVSATSQTTAVILSNSSTAAPGLKFDIHGNTANGTGSLAFGLTHTGTGTSNGKFRGNSVTHTAGTGTDAMQVVVEGNGTAIVEISNNTVSGNYQRGLNTQSGAGSGALHLTVVDNTLTQTNAAGLQNMVFTAGLSGGGTTNLICVNLVSNEVTPAGANAAYRFQQRDGYTFQLDGLSPSPTTNPADVRNWVVNAPKSNLPNDTSRVLVNIGTTSPFTNGTCLPATYP